MALTQLSNYQKEELALVEIATAILEEHKTVMPFSSLVQEIQDFLAVDAETFRSRLSQFYTDLNTDGSFISLGNNEWGLRAWYPVDAIDESIHEIDDEDAPKRKKTTKKVNVFAESAADDDVIDYNDDDPEDEDFGEVAEEADVADVEDADVEDDDENDIAVGDDETIEDNLSELTGTNDLDDLGDGDIEK